ncbi:hypothetical protein [Stieleria varia]|uniref:Uncharacterized protein n=1 Tax=Stieleria varia TaxID=2528005 RepID=A0A5C6A208_9BACT|nr:hypothetical protein [Stieleria varia]TWT93892.1 hypothetical protein Pla52n_57200 [Stieleria varia]
MKRLLVASVVALAAAVCISDTASAQHPGGYPFVPFGFYQPYGVQFNNNTPTPPYFALNPPVYYGARYARPYGMSPFASPPMVSAPSGYNGRLRTDFYQPPRTVTTSSCGTCYGQTSQSGPEKLGAIRQNPFVESGQIASK